MLDYILRMVQNPAPVANNGATRKEFRQQDLVSCMRVSTVSPCCVAVLLSLERRGRVGVAFWLFSRTLGPPDDMVALSGRSEHRGHAWWSDGEGCTCTGQRLGVYGSANC